VSPKGKGTHAALERLRDGVGSGEGDPADPFLDIQLIPRRERPKLSAIEIESLE
jgi:hypothetical protein